MHLRLGIGLLVGFIVSCSGAADSDVPSPIVQLGAVDVEGTVETSREDAPAEDSAEGERVTTEGHDGEGIEGESFCGCGETTPLPPVARARPARVGDVLVWFAEQDATLRLDAATGEIVGSETGRRVYAGGRQWTHEVTGVDVPRVACKQGADADTWPSRSYRSALVSDGDEIEILGVRVDADAPTTDFSRSAELHASVGPYLFFRIYDSESYCDGTRRSESRHAVYDLERRTFVDLTNEVDGWAAASRSLNPPAAAALVAPRPTQAIVPVFGDSAISFARHFTWITRDATFLSLDQPVELDPEPELVPRSIAPHARMPAGLAKFRAEHLDYSVGGFSVIDR